MGEGWRKIGIKLFVWKLEKYCWVGNWVIVRKRRRDKEGSGIGVVYLCKIIGGW